MEIVRIRCYSNKEFPKGPFWFSTGRGAYPPLSKPLQERQVPIYVKTWQRMAPSVIGLVLQKHLNSHFVLVITG